MTNLSKPIAAVLAFSTVLLLFVFSKRSEEYSPLARSRQLKLFNPNAVSLKPSKPIAHHLSLEFVHIAANDGLTVEKAAWTGAGLLWGACHWSARPFGIGCNDPDWVKLKWGEAHWIGYAGTKFIGQPWLAPPQWVHPSPYEGTDTFCVVRNPYDRMVAEYQLMCKKTFRKASKDAHDMNDWIQAKLRDLMKLPHYPDRFLPQHFYVFSKEREQTITHILRHETLKTEFDSLMREYNLTNVQLPTDIGPLDDNSVFKKGMLSADTIKMINQLYALDFQLLGYEMVTRPSHFNEKPQLRNTTHMSPKDIAATIHDFAMLALHRQNNEHSMKKKDESSHLNEHAEMSSSPHTEDKRPYGGIATGTNQTDETEGITEKAPTDASRVDQSMIDQGTIGLTNIPASDQLQLFKYNTSSQQLLNHHDLSSDRIDDQTSAQPEINFDSENELSGSPEAVNTLPIWPTNLQTAQNQGQISPISEVESLVPGLSNKIENGNLRGFTHQPEYVSENPIKIESNGDSLNQKGIVVPKSTDSIQISEPIHPNKETGTDSHIRVLADEGQTSDQRFRRTAEVSTSREQALSGTDSGLLFEPRNFNTKAKIVGVPQEVTSEASLNNRRNQNGQFVASGSQSNEPYLLDSSQSNSRTLKIDAHEIKDDTAVRTSRKIAMTHHEERPAINPLLQMESLRMSESGTLDEEKQLSTSKPRPEVALTGYPERVLIHENEKNNQDKQPKSPQENYETKNRKASIFDGVPVFDLQRQMRYLGVGGDGTQDKPSSNKSESETKALDLAQAQLHQQQLLSMIGGRSLSGYEMPVAEQEPHRKLGVKDSFGMIHQTDSEQQEVQKGLFKQLVMESKQSQQQRHSDAQDENQLSQHHQQQQRWVSQDQIQKEQWRQPTQQQELLSSSSVDNRSMQSRMTLDGFESKKIDTQKINDNENRNIIDGYHGNPERMPLYNRRVSKDSSSNTTTATMPVNNTLYQPQIHLTSETAFPIKESQTMLPITSTSSLTSSSTTSSITEVSSAKTGSIDTSLRGLTQPNQVSQKTTQLIDDRLQLTSRN